MSTPAEEFRALMEGSGGVGPQMGTLSVAGSRGCSCGCGQGPRVMIAAGGAVLFYLSAAEVDGTIAALAQARDHAWPRPEARGPLARLRRWLAGGCGRR